MYRKYLVQGQRQPAETESEFTETDILDIFQE